MVFFGNFLFTKKESYSCRGTKLPIPRPQALCLFTAARAFPHVTGVFLIVVVPPTVPAQLSAAAACYYGKNYSFCCVTGYYILCPTGTPTHCGAPRRNGRDLIIATRPAHPILPSLLSAAAAQAVQAIPEPTMLPTALHALSLIHI